MLTLLLLILKGVDVEASGWKTNNLAKFTPLGGGLCLDSQGNSYDFSTHILVPDAETCAMICYALIPSYGAGSVVGMEYSLPDQVCYCDFENDKLTSKPDNAIDWFSGYLGTGLPLKSDGNLGYTFICYQRNPLSLAPVKPSPAVPNKPTQTNPVPTLSLPTKPSFLTSQFTYVGEGICCDSQTNYYDFVKYNLIASVDTCAAKCSDLIKAYPKGCFVGMEYSSTSKECLCNLENDKLSTTPAGASEWYGGNSGSGLPVKADSGVGKIPFTCYKVSAVAPTQPAPTIAKPAPTAPTPVGLPPTISSFVFVGEGVCLGMQNATYDWAQYYAVPSLSDCAQKCSVLATAYNWGSVVGMEYFSPFQDCYCDFENNTLTSLPNGSDSWNNSNTGKGLPFDVGSTGTLGWSCFKFGKNSYLLLWYETHLFYQD